MDCKLTGIFTTDVKTSSPNAIYTINLWGTEHTLIWSNNESWTELDYIKHQHVFRGLLFNGKWPYGTNTKITPELLKKVLAEADYPRTITEKINSIFLYFVNAQSSDGASVSVGDIQMLADHLYLKNTDELIFYANALHKKGLINLYSASSEIKFNITYDGLEYAMSLQEEGQNSKNCFVAMSFDKEENIIFSEAILPACEATGFIAKRIDKDHIDSDITINDAIIAGIKAAKFCIADFTKHKGGVYFEAGYALGRGIKVIYCCHKDHFDKAHFDVNHFQHIIYTSTEELKEALINKINAWIKD
jgi:nucleoside 2-deoxyribosyltransferase